jgi:alpha-acetolactate decarboxylase
MSSEFESEELQNVDVTDASEILETLKRVEERMQALKEERSRLFEANQMLVELVEHLEDELSGFVDPEEVGSIAVEGYEYSFTEGWRSTAEGHKKRMELEPDVDVDEVEDQIREVRNSIQQVGNRD